jgi:putative hydrolase of the HAD superfamily
MEQSFVNIRAVIFDIYGTLLEVGPPPADAESRWQSLWRDMLHCGPSLSRLEFAVATSRVVARHHETARARGIPWPEVHWPSVVLEVIPGLAQLSNEQQPEFLFRQIQTGHTTGMTAGTAAMLRRLKKDGCMIGIASNAQAYTLRELQEALASHGLGMDLFEHDLCFWSFEHGFSKPDPHVFQILTARLATRGIQPDEALMIGDREDNDIVPARAHGWQAWHLSSSPAANNRLSADWHPMIQRFFPG